MRNDKLGSQKTDGYNKLYICDEKQKRNLITGESVHQTTY
jgi:hypothetical protein